MFSVTVDCGRDGSPGLVGTVHQSCRRRRAEIPVPLKRRDEVSGSARRAVDENPTIAVESFAFRMPVLDLMVMVTEVLAARAALQYVFESLCVDDD